MKRFLMVVLVCVFVCMSAVSLASDIDYSFLDGMTLEQLEALKKEVASRITDAKTEKVSADPEELGMWSFWHYDDEFGLPTNENYIIGFAWGTFSNSAATNRSLSVHIIVDKKDIGFELYEYSNNLVKNFYSSKEKVYNVAMMDSEGTVHRFSGYYKVNGDKMYFSEENEKIIMKAFEQNGTVRFSITEERGGTSYSFEINDTSYFANAYNALMAK